MLQLENFGEHFVFNGCDSVDLSGKIFKDCEIAISNCKDVNIDGIIATNTTINILWSSFAKPEQKVSCIQGNFMIGYCDGLFGLSGSIAMCDYVTINIVPTLEDVTNLEVSFVKVFTIKSCEISEFPNKITSVEAGDFSCNQFTKLGRLPLINKLKLEANKITEFNPTWFRGDFLGLNANPIASINPDCDVALNTLELASTKLRGDVVINFTVIDTLDITCTRVKNVTFGTEIAPQVKH